MDELLSWGRYPLPHGQTAESAQVGKNPFPNDSTQALSLPRGAGRSYGDICLLSHGRLISSLSLDRLINFSSVSGILRADSGVLLGEILKVFVPKGWFVPVLPGTQYVTLGGAVAADLHGKNHHAAGSFGNWVRSFELVRSTGERLICSETQNRELFLATIGGLGLTGFITWVEIQLIPVESSMIETEAHVFTGLDAFYERSQKAQDVTYTVAWLDVMQKRVENIRGVFFEGTHAKSERQVQGPRKTLRKFNIPVVLPDWFLNQASMKAFNLAYYLKHRPSHFRLQDYRSFFFPLDSVGDWNRIYGRRGFLQYQCMLPIGVNGRSEGLTRLLEAIVQRRMHSFLTVLKVFGDKPSKGLLSFPGPGVTLALDFAMTGDGLFKDLEELDKIVLEFKGRIYAAKDARVSAASFQQMYPRWRELEVLRDPAIQSDFWKRVTIV